MSNFKKLAVVLTFACLFTLKANAGVSGFVDAQFASGLNVTGSSDNSPTFRVGDGAVYFSEKSGNTMVMVDIPFMWSGTGTTNDFSIATGKAQAFVMHSYSFGLAWAIGQFDSGVGLEANDSGNRRWAQMGLIRSVAPKTHTGLLFDYTNGPVNAKALVANNYDNGLRHGDNLDYAAALKYTHEMFYISAGYLHHKDVGTGLSDMILDIMVGTKQGAFSADAEFGMLKKHVLGVTEGIGFGVWLNYNMGDTDLGGRFEMLRKVVNYSQMQWTLGPSHKMNEKTTVRLEYTGTSTTALESGTAVSNHGGIVSTVFKF